MKEKIILQHLSNVYFDLELIKSDDILLPIIKKMFNIAKKMLCKLDQHKLGETNEWYEKHKNQGKALEDFIKKNIQITETKNSSLVKHLNKKNRKVKTETICELHRQVYQILHERNNPQYNEIMKTLKNTYEIGKQISTKLHDYNAKMFYSDRTNDYWAIDF